MSKMLDAARGWPVFPCKPGSKHPATKHGFENATTDETQIRRWWKRGPDRNVAIATGTPSGGVAVDLDIKRGPDGYATHRLLEPCPARTPTATTPSKGLHRCHAMNGTPIKSRADVHPGVDIKGDGGYILVAPSVISEAEAAKHDWVAGTYEWTLHPDDAELAPVPAWVLATAEPKHEPRKAPSEPQRPRTPGTTTPYGRKALDGELAALRAAAEGSRNDQLNRSAPEPRGRTDAA